MTLFPGSAHGREAVDGVQNAFRLAGCRWSGQTLPRLSGDPNTCSKRGKTPILSPEEAHELFAGIPTDTLVGLRDRALIGVLIYSFARVSAAVSMRVEDYFPCPSGRAA